MADVRIVPDEAALALAATGELTALIEQSIDTRGAAVISLTGGSTPQRSYRLLGDATQPWRRRVDWRRVHLFWGDERHVPPDHDDSNFKMAYDAFVRHVPIPASQVHRMRTELTDPLEVAGEYESTLRDGFAAADRTDLTFDVMLLGLGEDGHIASIFSGSDLLGADRQRLRRVVAVWVEQLTAWRITLTPAALLDARAIRVLVAGAAKAAAVRAALELPLDEQRWPVQLLRAAGERVHWTIDRASAAELTAR